MVYLKNKNINKYYDGYTSKIGTSFSLKLFIYK